MTPNELQNILQSDKKLTLQEVEDILDELKFDTIENQNKMMSDCDFKDGYDKELWISNYGFYNGESNAFYICLDLLAKVDRNEPNAFNDIKTGLQQAIEYEKKGE